MGKRSSFARRPRDQWPTPPAALEPLLPYLARHTPFIEPCAGDGVLMRQLQDQGHICCRAFDLDPGQGIERANAFDWHRRPSVPYNAYRIITNPPWSRDLLHPMILHFTAQHPCWLLYDADWLHTRQSAPFLPILSHVVSVGRVRWIEDSPSTGKDNAAWYYFHAHTSGPARFAGRQAA